MRKSYTYIIHTLAGQWLIEEALNAEDALDQYFEDAPWPYDATDDVFPEVQVSLAATEHHDLLDHLRKQGRAS